MIGDGVGCLVRLGLAREAFRGLAKFVKVCCKIVINQHVIILLPISSGTVPRYNT